MLLPNNPSNRSVLAELNRTIHRAEAIYGSVCFWSIGPDVLPGLATLLSMPDSFCIVDIHLPTNVDKLNRFHRQGASLFLFFKELNPKRPDAYLQRHLLHTKMLLFDLPDGHAELWVGSHNFTKQALKGVNREASLVIPCLQGDALYTQAWNYLQTILDDPDCRPFDPELIDTYKFLQGFPSDEIEGGVHVLPVSWRPSDMDDLTQQVILLAGDDPKEAGQFALISSAIANNRAQLAVQAYDLDGGPIRKFTAELHNQGIIIPADPATYDIAFGQRRLASRVGNRLPLISARSEEHTAGALRRFKYWVSIRIGDELPADTQFEDDKKPAEAKWKTDMQTTYFVFKVLDREPQEETYHPHPSNYHQQYSASGYNEGYSPDPEDLSEEAAAVRVARWLARARQRRPRPLPPEPTAVHAVFQKSKRNQAENLSALEAQFVPDNLPALREQYEVPILEATYGDHPARNVDDNGQKVLEVKKLLSRKVLR